MELENLRQLVYPDVAIFQGDRLLASSIKDLQPSVHLVNNSPATGGQGTLEIGNDRYSIRIIPPLNQLGSKKKPVEILFAANYSSYWSPYKLLGENALYFSAMMLLLAGFLGVRISRRFLTRPIQLLERATQAVAMGNMKPQVSVKRNDELGQLGESFNAMLGALNLSRGELERNRQRFRDFASSSSDWLWETDRSGHFTFVSSSVSETLNMSAATWLGRTPAEVFPGSSLGELTRLLRPADKEQRSFKDAEIWVHALSGEAHCLRLNGVPVFSGNTFKGYRGTARDITKLKQDEKRMVMLANQDHLTGLSNRRRFLEELDHEIRRVERNGQLGVLLLIDLDHLKLVNDTAGHAAGDQIIVQVAGMLKYASREEDFLARISGDEFAVAYSAMSEDQGLQKARQLLECINALKPKYGGRTLNISASVGVVTFPQQGKVPVELMAKADAAMSVAKTSGRNRVYRYDETDMMRERMDNQLVWKDRLLEALEQDALHLAFQPIVAVSSGKVHHYEVLVRMVEKNGALIAPGKFIPAAEQFGLIQWVDRQIITKAIRRLADLPDEMRDVGFSVNLSGLSVGRQDTYELIEQEIRQGGVDPARITFEITETAACEQLNNAVDFIHKIRQLGCMVSLDDFGVGFSSFTYLKHLSADVLKIDGSFIRDIHNNNADQLFVKALVDVARGMGMRTIAEFVENEQVFDRVRDLGVDYVQGHYLGKPQSILATVNAEADDSFSASVA
jgi:diguanylate cyclase (GGDEF)-like protein/PAS domain S-box-containing protein